MRLSTHVNMQYSHCMTPGMISREYKKSNKILSQLSGADPGFREGGGGIITIFTCAGGYGRGVPLPWLPGGVGECC